MPIKILIAAVLALMVALPVDAKPKHCPPGHAKKGWCAPGSVYALPPGIRMKRVDHWEDYGLRRPRRGERYVIVEDEVFLIIEATLEVIEAIGAVNRVLN